MLLPLAASLLLRGGIDVERNPARAEAILGPDVWELVRATAEAGTCVVLTTHSFEEAQRLADRVVIVADGRVVADGPTAQVAGPHGLEDVYFSLTRQERHD